MYSLCSAIGYLHHHLGYVKIAADISDALHMVRRGFD